MADEQQKCIDFELTTHAQALGRLNPDNKSDNNSGKSDNNSNKKRQANLEDSFCTEELRAFDKAFAKYSYEASVSFLSENHASLQQLLDIAVEFGATTGRKSY